MLRFGRLSSSCINEINTLVQTVRIVSRGIRMEFDKEKHALANRVKGKLMSERIQVPEGNNIKDINPQSPGILPEGRNIKVLSAQESLWKG